MTRLVVLGALAIFFTIATASLKPPVITEAFTLLPCPANPQTTLELEGCAEHRIVKSDAAINARVKSIFALLGRVRSVGAQGRFVRGERIWLTYRRAVCESRADVYEGGTLAGLVAANCTADANDAHLKDLRAFDRNLRPH